MDFENDVIIGSGYDRVELLQVAEAVARDKGIEAEQVIDAMEQAIQKQYEKIVREIFALALDKEPTQEELEYYAKKLLDRDMTGDEIYEELVSKNE